MTQPVVRTTDLWKLFKLGDEVVKALRGVDLTVSEGEFLCIMGPSGSGKSTLLHLLGGLERPTKGEIELYGQPLSGLTESQLSLMRHKTVGFIFQSFNLIPLLTATENAELPLMFEPVDAKEVRRQSSALLERVGLGRRLDHPGRPSCCVASSPLIPTARWPPCRCAAPPRSPRPWRRRWRHSPAGPPTRQRAARRCTRSPPP
jgi:ABC-type lipoprotein export system ATPase subunit